MSIEVRIRNGLEPDMGSGGASEGDIRGDASDLIAGSGVVDLLGGHLLVHQSASPDMNVVVDPGIGYIPNTSFDETDSDDVRFWEAVVFGTTLSRTVAIPSNSSGSTRIDLITLFLNTATTPDSTASNIATLVRVAGTPGAGAPSTPSNSLLLATVTVANGASSIGNGVIASNRAQIKINHDFTPDVRVTLVASSATPTPNIDTTDEYKITALAATATVGAPTGTPTPGQVLIIIIKDNGTARALSWNSIYREIGVFLPSTTILGKMLYIGCKYNAQDTKWDVLAVQQQF